MGASRVKGETQRSRERGRDLPRSLALASPMDDLNRSIVDLLGQDGRMPFKDIAARLEVSEGTVRNRVNWMKQAGLLRIVAIADPTALSYKADAMLGIKVAPGVTPRIVADSLTSHSDVVYVLWVTGRYDLLVEIVSDDETAFHAFLESHVYGNADIAEVEVMGGLHMFKNQFLLKRNVPL